MFTVWSQWVTMQTPERKIILLGKFFYPVVLEVKHDHCRSEGTSRIHAGTCIWNLEDT